MNRKEEEKNNKERITTDKQTNGKLVFLFGFKKGVCA
jgi:hypothetical protein